jgi:hypothetical protein
MIKRGFDFKFHDKTQIKMTGSASEESFTLKLRFKFILSIFTYH